MGEINTSFDDVKALLADLAALDIRLKVADGKLGYDAPTGAFTDALKERVRALRPTLLAHLGGTTAIVAPLSSSQERMWFLNRLEVQHGSTMRGSYTEHLAFSLTGSLDRAALEKALSAICARHGALRSLFREGCDGPEQVIAPPTPLQLTVVDLSATPEVLDRALQGAAHRPVDLATDPHVRFTLFALAADRHVLSVSAHHAAWDGWSNGVFAADLATAYNALHAGRSPALPALSRDVADLARAQRAALANGGLDAPLQRLCLLLQGFPTRLELPTDRPHPAIADGRGAALNLRLEPTAAAALATAGRRSGATPFMAVLAAWALLLSRLSGQPRLLIGTPVAAREDAAEEAVIGYLSNTMVVPVDVGAADSFGALVVQIRDRVLEVMAGQRVPFEKLVEALAPPHSRATTPLVQTIFAMQPCFVPAPALDGLSVSVLPRHNEAARYELMLNLETTPDNALEGPLTYATALFDHATVSGWANRLLDFLRSAPQQWDKALDRSPLGKAGTTTPAPVTAAASPRSGAPFATATERALAAIWGEFLQTAPSCRDDDFFMLGGHSLLLMRVIHRVNSSGLGRLELAGALGATQLSAMAALIDTTAQPDSTSDQPATLPEAEFRRVTESFNPVATPYPRDASITDLWRTAANRHAARIALTGPDGASMTYAALDARAEAIAAALQSSGAIGPTVALAVGRGFDAVAAILAIWKAGAAYLPLDAKLPPLLIRQLMGDADAKLILSDAENTQRLADLDTPVLRLDALPATATTAPPRTRHGGDPAYVMFTSGTTGRAKGVVIPHRAIARLALNHDLLGMQPGEVMAQLAPLAFDATTVELWSTLLNGATLHFIPDQDALDPARLGTALHQNGVTTLWLTAGLFNRAADEAPAIFAGLRLLMTGGETLSPPHVRRVMHACPELQLCNAYGPTENCCFTTMHTIATSDVDGPIPIGQPIAHTRVYVVDEQLKPVAAGVWGELVCGGDGVALGYAGRPDLTAAAFVTLPWGAGERVYRSGDVARWRPDGVIEFGGRRDGQVKIRGHRIETAAIEAVLAECADVRDAAVVVSGEGVDQALVACVASDGNSGENAWRRKLAEQLPIYMMPARFLVMPTLPVNANGKRDRHALQALVAARTQPADDFPLSTGQERLWVMQRLFPDSGVYNVPIVFDVDGPLDSAALARALIALEERHHALRLRVFDGADGLHQRLAPAGSLILLHLDLTGEPDPVAAADARQIAELSRPFHLDRESGARALLMQLGAAQWRVLLVLHHAVVDGWSTSILLRDLAAFYTGSAAELPPEPAMQFEQFAAWQRTFANSAEGSALLERWRALLTPLPEALKLPTDHRRPPVKNFRGDTLPFAFSAEQSAALDRLARAESATPFALVTALVQALLHRLTGQKDLALGTLVAGRDRPEVQDTVGFFVNTLVLRQQVEPAAAFRQLLANTRATCLHAVAHQHCPFEALVEAVGAPRDLSRNPLFDVLVVWQSDDPVAPSLPGLVTRAAPVTYPFAKFDLAFHFGRRDGQIICQIEHSAELFEKESIARLFARLETLAAAVLADPDRKLGSLPVLPAVERKLVVEQFNATTMALETRRTVMRPFLDRLAADPSAPAILWNGEAPLDYRRFAARAATLARHLVAAGVQPGETVAVCTPRSPELLIAIYGILMAGGAYAPLGTDQPAARLAGMLEDLGNPLVLVAPDCRELMAGARSLDLNPLSEEEAETLDLGKPDGLAYVLFTSGSTGRPKGVAIEQHSVLNRILWMQSAFPIGPGDVILQKTPVTFDVSVWELFWWSWTGAAIALPPPGAERDPPALVDQIERDGVTVLHFVPSMLAAFLTCLEDGRTDARRLRGLRYVFASGEALDPALVERFDRLLHRPFGIELHNLYGPTEATVDVTWQPCSPWSGGEVVPIGRPIANTTVYILDGDGNPTPLGIAGEIHLGGPQVARGYVKQPELTQERFLPDPFAGHGTLYRTGDLGCWRHDGTIEYLGRLDQQVKIRGQRIEPGEIEHALETHPAVERAVVVAVTAQGTTELHGYVLARDEIDSAALRGHLRERVSEAMIPSRFFRLEALPLTSSGKLDRKALSGVPLDPAGPVPVENLSNIEAEIRALWKTLLPDTEPGLHDGFFDAGGNSMLVIRLHERLNARWPGRFTITDLFSCATIAEQAKRVAPLSRPQPHQKAPAVFPLPATDAIENNKADRHAIAIVGMAIRMPGSDDLADFWRDVSSAADHVRPLPPAREAETRGLLAMLGLPDPLHFSEAAFLDDVMGFDPKRLRLSPADASLLDPEQRLFLDTALRALEDAGRGGVALDNARVGVFIGGAPDPAWRSALMRGASASRTEQLFVLNVPSNIATRLSFLHNWRGPAALIDTACSSSLVALHTACRALRVGECDWALVGGAKTILSPHADGERLSIDSSDARTHAFADDADGTGAGEGCAVFLLRPLADALAEGDAIHGVILGSAVNQDGASSGMAAPNPAAQAEVIAAAARDAGVSLSTLSYIEAHGTGTVLGDPVEIDGLTRAFALDTTETGFAAIGSGKGNYGHLDGAAGALGMARALMCLTHDQAPPQPFFKAPNPRIDFAKAPVAVTPVLAPLADRGTPRRAGISGFGLSGINAHVVIEAAPRVVRTNTCSGWITVGLSAPDAASLRSYAGALVTVLSDHPDWPLADIARTLSEGRDGLEARLAVWVCDRDDLLARLAVFAAAPKAVDGLLLTGTAARARNSETISSVHADESAARAAVTAFVAGARLTWPTQVPAGHVHLPPAPLARRRCAPELTAVATTKTSAPWLGPAAITAQGRFYPLDVHSPAFWPSAEHHLDGAPTLVGMAFPALLAEAMPEKALCLRDLHWIRPLRPAELKAGSVTLAIAPDGAASLTGQTLDGRWLTFVQAVLESSEATSETLDLGTLTQRCAVPLDAPPFQPQSGLVTVSERWDCLQRYAPGHNEALAWLHRPDSDAALRLHPGLLDVAIGQALEEFGLVPTACDRIIIHGALPAEPVAHIVRRATADGAEADIRLADRASRQVVVALLGLHLTRLGSVQTPAAIVPSLPHWHPAPLNTRDPGGPVVLIGEGPLAERIAAALSAVGRLVAHSGSAAIDESTRICIGAVDTPAIVFAPASGPDTGLRAAAAMRTILAALRHPTRLLALGEGAFAVDASAPLDPFLALTYGVVTAATLEEPLLTARYIDCDDATDPSALLTELAGLEQNPCAIAWRNGQRLIRRFEPMEVQTRQASWPTTGCCVVSGGTGGLALMLAETLAAGGQLALALLSRAGLPTGDHADAVLRQQKLDALRTAGLRIETYACDVADRAVLSATLARIRQELGPITAVVHNAGVPDGAFLGSGERSVTAYAGALDAKVTGTCLLNELTEQDPLEAFIMAGSLTALTGAPGHAAYTGANAFLDAFAVQRRRRGKPALTIDWCGISEMGMAVRLLKGQQSASVEAGSADVGPLLRQALASGAAQVSLLIPEVRALLAAPTTIKAAVAESKPTTVPPPARRTGAHALEAALATIWADVLGYDTVAPDDDFYALGGDSIAGMQIVRQIVSDLGQQMTLVDLFETGNVAALAERLRARTAEQRPQIQGLSPAPQRDRYPLAWEQLAVVQAEAAADMGTAYNLPSGLYLPEDVDLARLRAAADRLIERHEILRTRLIPAASENGEPMMQILPPAPAVFETLDCPSEGELLAALNASVRPFDLWAGVPMRLILGSVAGKPRALLLDVHHALADAFSMEVLLAGLAALYAGTAEPAPTVHLKDYAWWSREGEGAAAPETARAYWLERFKGPLPVLDLPADHPRPARHTWRAECVEFAITGDTIQRLRSFASQMRTTPFAMVTAAWALLLARYARLEELVLAVPVDSRDGAGMAGMTGMLVSLLPLRLTVNNGENLAELIQRTHSSHSEALRHRSYGLGRLLSDLAPPSAPDRPLLSEATLSYMNFAEGGGQARGTGGMTPFGLGRSDGKSDLAIFVRDLPEQMVMALEYYADLFDRERMERMGRHLRTLLTALVSADPATQVAQLPLLDTDEAAWLATVGQGPMPALPLARGLFGVFADCVAATPAAIALEGSGCRLTYAELQQRAGGIAAHLRAAGVLPGDRVALHVERNAEAIVLLLGIVAAGAAYVPLDPAYPAERVAWIVQDAACRTVIADAAGRALLPADCRVLAAETLAGATADSFVPPPSEGPAYVMYTSGSTGTPKGVIVPQTAVLRLALGGGDLAMTAEDRLMQSGPLAFDASTFEIWAALLNGARLCVANREEVLDPEALAAALSRYGATVLWLTTGLFNRQVDVAPESFKGMRAVLTGGDAASTPHLARALSACPEVNFFNGYGPTENTTFTTLHRIVPADTQPGPVPIGRSIAHTWVAVLEPGGAPAPTGVWGEIVTGGLGLADGYLNRADLTAERFVTDAAGQRFYRTGDLGRWRADGVLEFGGRQDGQIKLRGFRIELEEIEQALNGHPAIAASAALFLRDAHGEGSIVACIQPTGETPSTATLRDWLGQRLPAYMVPRRFVSLTELPVNSNGKVDRASLTASLPPPTQDIAGDPPHSGNERLIADVFAEVFGQPVDNRDANFLDLGGHSLLAIKVVNRIAQMTGVRLSMSSFFSVPTVAGLAVLIAGGNAEGDVIPRIPNAPTHPASHAQARLYLASRMEGSETAYNITFALPFTGRLDLDALRSALPQLLARHETLRTGFIEEDGNIRQRIAPELEITLTLDDLSACADPHAEALRLARREATTAFDLASPPLLRARAICLGNPENWLIMLVLHHIVGDGWSSRLLLQELASLYRTNKEGTAPALPALPIAYRDFAAWHNRQDWTASAAHWRTVLAGAPDCIALPTDRPTPTIQSHRGDSVTRTLPAPLSAGLSSYALEHGVTMASLGLALFAGLLYRLTRQGDLVIGMGVAGRDRAEVEGLIGFFVNVMPLRLHINDNTEFEPLVAQVHATLMTAMDHRNFPFDLLVRAVAPRRAANRQPLINVIYEYHRFDDRKTGRADENIFGAGHSVDPAFGKAVEEAIRTPTAKHDLLLFLTERQEACEFMLEYDTDLFDRTTAERWLGYLEQFAAMVVKQVNTDEYDPRG